MRGYHKIKLICQRKFIKGGSLENICILQQEGVQTVEKKLVGIIYIVDIAWRHFVGREKSFVEIMRR